MPRMADFLGRWSVERQIEDRRAGQAGRFDGLAEITPTPDGALYQETGVLILGGARFPAERRYLWAEGPDGIAVRFADGRAFHSFSPEGAPAARHWCDPDDYRVSYDFAAWPLWRAVWEVRGPRKDYRMDSLYRRAGGAAPRPAASPRDM